MITAQIIMVITLGVMILGLAPLYLTAVIGTTLAALAAGFPLMGSSPDAIPKLLVSAMNPVIIDMLGVLLFIGVMQASGYMDVIICKIMEFGRKKGGAPGIATAASLAAALLGSLTAFTQPVIMATVAGPASTRLGLSSNKTSAIISLANIGANNAGFTHPTMLAILGLTGVKFGLINFWTFAGCIGIYIFVYYRAKREMIQDGIEIRKDLEDTTFTLPENAPSFAKAFFPFLVLCITFFMGIPIFLVGVGCSVLVILMAGLKLAEGEKFMLNGVTQIAIPIVAIISLMYMSIVISKIGLVSLVADYVSPYLAFAPIQILLMISALAGTITQSNAASAPIVLPFVQIVLGLGADPLAVSFAAISGCAIMQLFLSGGALTALPVVAGVIPGTNQKLANKWQRPSMIVGLGISFLITFII
ncbi:citrate transporter [Anaerosinus massiliensis]|uniref:citrate transporter n=1 Tax=Massilibacillus massiliensis TaxID=1806837 RepID=UPI000DA5F546|nr:citrate transporter [Massilibacillus massiliensis]